MSTKDKSKTNKNTSKYQQKKKRNYNELKKNKYDKEIECSIIKKYFKKKFKKSSNTDEIDSDTELIHQTNLFSLFNIKKLYLIKDEDINYNIEIPEEIDTNISKSKSNNNYKLYHNIVNHINIDQNNVAEISVSKDGNCFYNNLSLFFTNTEKYNNFFRYTLFKYCKDNAKEIFSGNPYVTYFGNVVETKNYLQRIKENYFWAGDVEITHSMYLFNINIAIYEKINTNNKTTYRFIKYYENDTNINNNFPLIILLYEGDNHYMQLIYKDYLKDKKEKIKYSFEKSTEINIEIKSSKQSIKNINNFNELPKDLQKDIEFIILKYKKLNLNANDDENDEIIFNHKILQGYNYPKYPNKKNGKTLLLDIRNYFIIYSQLNFYLFI